MKEVGELKCVQLLIITYFFDEFSLTGSWRIYVIFLIMLLLRFTNKWESNNECYAVSI